MTRTPSLALIAFLISAASAFGTEDPPRTKAEATDYRETSTYADVVSFCKQLANLSPVVKLGTIGVSQENRDLPLVILADPPIANAKAARASEKPVLFVVANIHAGEVDGKEALMTFAREIAMGSERKLLDHLIFAFVPIFNADGNDRFGKNRPAQAGPEFVGTRANAQKLDLNRDFVKLETPEVRALVRALDDWNPAVYVDLHTTNGSFHRYALTFEGGGCPAGDSRIIDFTRSKLLPTVSQRMEAATGLKSTFYGNFNRDRSKWETVPPTPRYGFHYVGLTNRISILSESYSYSPFPERVRASKAFVKEIATYVAEHRKEVKDLLAAARAKELQQPSEGDAIVLRHRETTAEGPKAILGFVEELKDGRRKPTATTKEYPVEYMGGSTPTVQVKRPFAYVIPRPSPEVVEKLRQHGVAIEELESDLEMNVEIYRVEKIVRGRLFQGHQPTSVEVVARKERVRLPRGAIVVRTAQPLGRLASYLLEPQSSDGFAQWNAFEKDLKEGAEYPVLRLVDEQPLATKKSPLRERHKP